MNLDVAKDWFALAPAAFCRAMKKLSFREREILKQRIGIQVTGPLTRKQTAESFKVSISRVRQIESKACRRMYHFMRETVN